MNLTVFERVNALFEKYGCEFGDMGTYCLTGNSNLAARVFLVPVIYEEILIFECDEYGKPIPLGLSFFLSVNCPDHVLESAIGTMAIRLQSNQRIDS